MAHLLVNGQVRDVLLFGGLSLWAIVGIVLANLRDGEWQRPGPVAPWKDALLIIVAAAATGLMFHFHGWLFGVSPIQIR